MDTSRPDLPTGPATAPPRVLLVEEDSAFRRQLVEVLVDDGYQVDCAGDGAEALAWLAAQPLPDAVVIDMVLPRVNAVAFRRVQLLSPELRRVPTIALAAVRALPGADDVAFQAVVPKASALDRLVEALALLRGPLD